ncbi:MAG: histidinol phosphate phosphatase [Bacteroidetes bacterium HGW-Bacteroidetes-7]|jgi:histidinol-phosphatase (PHP family)|nr:MAG: histidinol phosphate phosphatase [Bacteroidetes bacterium HGW-Bacteroidetes-7]
MNKYVDTHTHSSYSPDSRMSIAEAAEYAFANGLAGITFTDHLDLKAPGDNLKFAFDPAEQQAEIYEVAKQSSIKLLTGIEIGLQPCNLVEIKDFLSTFSFDTIIASIHFVDGVDPYEGQYYEGKTEKEAYGRYLEIMAEMVVAYPDFDILGHYDYIARYAPYKTRTIHYRDFADILDTIFRSLIYNGKSLEINTNTYRLRNGAIPVLDRDILLRYRELGGEIITLGSDAHSKERLGEEFENFRAVLKNMGYKYVVNYEKRKPLFTAI